MTLRSIRWLLAAGLTLLAGGASATLITNGGFDSGDLSGWTTFTFDSGSHIGSIGTPAVVSFDTDGDTVASNAARFQVGQDSSGPVGGGTPRVGGGIFQAFSSGAGLLSLMVDVAATSAGTNADGGLFELLLDGLLVASFDPGSIGAGRTERGMLSATETVSAGLHELRIRMSRGFGNSSATPFQYVDDVVAQLTPVPAPTSLALMAAGLAGAVRARRRAAV